jgi:F-type H+-transporting ATPase subunit epsilon
MKLQLTSLGDFVAVYDDVVSLRAEDASGSFGILPGHADLLTVLDIGVASWRHADGRERHGAVRGGVLRVLGGRTIEIATREAIVSDDLEQLESQVLAQFRAREEMERSAHTREQQLELQALREIMRYLQPEHAGNGRRGA